jgi:2,3-bisphosphoglycerate-independent phosphoglycerate mutase
MKKILLIVIDGLGDNKIPQLKNKTPLEAAHTPNLDFLAKNGILGEVLPYFEKGKLPTSEDCHLALFGYDPKKDNPGRGVLEVLGIGEKIKKGDICFRGNFATINNNLKIIDRRAGRIEETENLIATLNKIKIKGAKIIIKKAFGHRFGLILRGKNLSPKVTSNDPKKVGVKVLKIFGHKKTAKILNEFLKKAKKVLENHPENKKREKEGKLVANFLLLRGGGTLKKVKTFKEKYKKNSAFVAGGTLYKGIGRFLGMKEIKVKGATGNKETNLKGKFLAAKRALKNYDFVFLHIKATDNLAEDGDFQGKKEFIEKIDLNLKEILNLKNTLIVVTSDHSTCSLFKSHCKIPAPLLIYGGPQNGGEKFSESNCQKGRLGKIRQVNLMEKIIEYAKI